MNRRQRPVNNARMIYRIIDFADMRLKPLAQHVHSGRCGGGHDKFQVRCALLQGAYKMNHEIDFAHADGMDPKNMAICQRLLEVRVIAAKSLPKTGAPVAPFRHPVKVIRRRQDKENREKNVV